jgi:NAD dependent epimerase/dehydratase family enzyme
VLGADMADGLLLTSQRVVPTALLESGFMFRDRDIAAVLA